jgi:CheY-like chemotaxis protein
MDKPISNEDMELLVNRGVAASIDQTPGPVGLGKNILLVEDSEPAIIQMKDILTESGYRIYVARNGQEALEHIEKFLPDAIILDLMMPEVDGFQVIETIRSVEVTAHIPVMILTAKHITKEELKFLKGNHIFQLVQKGAIGKTELLSVIRHMVTIPCELPTPPAIRPDRIQAVGRPVILVVEDNSDNMTTVKALLQENYEIIEAANGQTGIEQAEKYGPALILLDISLPVMNGFQVLGELRKKESLRHIPVIALTARVMSGDREEILAHGFEGYVSKPINEKLLEETIRGVLDAE